MTDTLTKSQQTIADYLGDLLAIESEIEQAMDHQKKLTKDDPIAGPYIQRFHDMVRDQRNALREIQSEDQGSITAPIKAAGATVFGKIAGVIDMVRTEAISKALRDDYVAFNLAAVSYSMFLATASALGDESAVALAKKHLTNYAAAAQSINQILASVVISELEKDGHAIEAKVTSDVTAAIDNAWKSTAPAS
jgi:ferritin-like metal-binding protein YciE